MQYRSNRIAGQSSRASAAPGVDLLRLTSHADDRLGHGLWIFRRNQQTGLPWPYALSQPGHVGGNHRPAGGKALERDERQGLPGSRGHDRAQAVLQQPEFSCRRRPGRRNGPATPSRAGRPARLKAGHSGPLPATTRSRRHRSPATARASSSTSIPFRGSSRPRNKQVGLRPDRRDRGRPAAARQRRIARRRRRWEYRHDPPQLRTGFAKHPGRVIADGHGGIGLRQGHAISPAEFRLAIVKSLRRQVVAMAGDDQRQVAHGLAAGADVAGRIGPVAVDHVEARGLRCSFAIQWPYHDTNQRVERNRGCQATG